MKTVFVIGAGPAGLFAAQKIARAGHSVIIFNRDIKPGGLAEYGIYPTKGKMKEGLRKQFGKILSLPNVSYFGHVAVGADRDFSIDELRELNPAALVFAVGAQGTKRLGLPGEEAAGVYASKDFVYHYNQLPPFALQDFSTGKRVCIVGMGNVMVDIAHWLLVDDPAHTAEEVTVIARRGPFEAKFDQKEFAHIAEFLDRRGLEEELRRVRERIAAVGQDITQVADVSFPILSQPFREPAGPRLRFRFLSSPAAIHPDPGGRIARLTLAENLLVPRDGGTKAQATEQTTQFEVDTMVFAIGDVVDPNVGLPYENGAYVTKADVTGRKQASYEVFDSESGKLMDGAYVVGWARQASTGLVGVARKDGETGAGQVLNYLEGAPDRTGVTPEEIRHRLERKGGRCVAKEELPYLARAEMKQAKQLNLPHFKFSDDGAMLAAIEKEKKLGNGSHTAAA